MKGGDVVKASLFVSIFLLKFSNAMRLEFYVTNHVDMDGVDIKLEATSSGYVAEAKTKVLSGEKLHWSQEILHDSPDMSFTCHVYICMGDYKDLFDSFIAFDKKWVDRLWTSHGHPTQVIKFEWNVDQAGPSLISPLPELQIKHSWRHVVLIYFVSNQFSSGEDVIISVESAADVVPSQVRVPYGKSVAGGHKLVANEEKHFELKCRVRGFVDGNSKSYGGFKIFDSAWFHGNFVGIRKYRWEVRERRAKMVYPGNLEVDYK